jgi:hypothetical protein
VKGDGAMRYIILLSLCVISLSASPALAVVNWNVELVGQTLGPAFDVFTAEDRAYLCAGSYLVVLDVADPRHPAEMGRIRTPGIAIEVHVTGSYAYVADGDEGLRVIDISTPSSPKEVGFYDVPGSASGVCVSRSYAYVANSAGGLCILRYLVGQAVEPADK